MYVYRAILHVCPKTLPGRTPARPYRPVNHHFSAFSVKSCPLAASSRTANLTDVEPGRLTGPNSGASLALFMFCMRSWKLRDLLPELAGSECVAAAALVYRPGEYQNMMQKKDKRVRLARVSCGEEQFDQLVSVIAPHSPACHSPPRRMRRCVAPS